MLLNETFARFEDNCKHIEDGKADCEFVIKLCDGMSGPYSRCAGLLQEYLLSGYLSATVPALPLRSAHDAYWSESMVAFPNKA